MSSLDAPAGEKRLRYSLRAFRHREFRTFWSAALVSNTGSWLSNLTVPYVLYDLTHSAVWVGLAAVAQFLPGVLMAPYSGALADRHAWELADELSRTRWPTPAALDEIRERGWAKSVAEMEPGLTAISAAVPTRMGGVLAALTVSGSTSHMTDERCEELLPDLLGTVRQIGRALALSNLAAGHVFTSAARSHRGQSRNGRSPGSKTRGQSLTCARGS